MRELLARHRTAIIAVVAVAGPIFFSYWSSATRWWWLALFITSMILLLVASYTPTRYEKIQLLSTALRALHRSLNLSDDERITINFLRSGRREKYEQLTDYYPASFGGVGRVFSFSHGIVGVCFKQKIAHHWSLPPNQTFEEAMIDRWDFSHDEVKRLMQDRKSFFAMPICESGKHAKAVLYMDSPQADRFAEPNIASIEQATRSLFLPILEEILRDSN